MARPLDKLFGWVRTLGLPAETAPDGYEYVEGDPYAEGHRFLDAFLLEAEAAWIPARHHYSTIDPAVVQAASETIKTLPSAMQRQVMHALFVRLSLLADRTLLRTWAMARRPKQQFFLYALRDLLDRSARRLAVFETEDWRRVLRFLAQTHRDMYPGYLPLKWMVTYLEKHVGSAGTPPALADAIRQAQRSHLFRSDDFQQRLERLTGTVCLADTGEPWADAIVAFAADTSPAWRALLEHLLLPTSARPSQKWLRMTQTHLDTVGRDVFQAQVLEWLALAARPQAQPMTNRNGDLLRGLLWACSLFPDPVVMRAVGTIGEACYQKIPHIGARSLKAGNASLYTLGATPGREAIVQLSRLRARVKDRRALHQINKALSEAATREGVTPADLEEMALPAYGFVAGVFHETLDGYRATLGITGTDTVTLAWTRPDGKPQKSIPKPLKDHHPEAIQRLKRLRTDVRKLLRAQRTRLEDLLRTERQWAYAAWQERYLEHGLLAPLSRRLIWLFTHEEQATTGMWHDGQLVHVTGEPLPEWAEQAHVQLWHPIHAEVPTVQAWRRFLEKHQCTQPFKQAHREIYLLTDAEQATGTYSNRFAAHILKQHQFAALCRERGWQYTLQGAFDAYDTPVLMLPHRRLRVEFDVDGSLHDDRLTDAGLYRYVRTDQVRFYEQEGTLLSLADVPPLVFSEVMRDVDLFVGVGSVGNDPSWQDHGEAGGTGYWERIAFGELSASAETRKAVLAHLLPRLAIADRCTIEGRYLRVRGALRLYKIHLGSGNILMADNNQYLCIVPDGKVATRTDQIWLPFEGDRLLSIILSKAFLLAQDTHIADPTIVRQIQRQ